jgi:hypothetical protein
MAALLVGDHVITERVETTVIPGNWPFVERELD